MRFFPAFCLAVLTGCAQTPTVQRVEVPVPVSCLPASMPERPSIHADADLRAMPSGEYVIAVTLDRGDLRAYAGELEAVVGGCK